MPKQQAGVQLQFKQLAKSFASGKQALFKTEVTPIPSRSALPKLQLKKSLGTAKAVSAVPSAPSLDLSSKVSAK